MGKKKKTVLQIEQIYLLLVSASDQIQVCPKKMYCMVSQDISQVINFE